MDGKTRRHPAGASLLVLAALPALFGACGNETNDVDAGGRARRDAGTRTATRDAGRRAGPADGGAAARAQPDAAAPRPPPPPVPEGPAGEGPVLLVRDLPLPASTDAGYEPIDIPWSALESLLVSTDAVSRGTRQSFQALTLRPWGDRPVEPFSFRREAEPLAQAGYWHPIPRVSILLVPHDPLGTGGPNVALYVLAGQGVRFSRLFSEHGLTCAGGGTLVEALAIQSGGEELRRLYGCEGLGEEATIDVLRLDGRRLVASTLHGSFLVH